MKKLIIILLSSLSAQILISCTSEKNETANLPTSLINFSGVSNVSFNVDNYSITAGQKWNGLSNNHACELDLSSNESSTEACSALAVNAQIASGEDVSTYLNSHQINLFDDANNQANFAFSGTLGFNYNNTNISCDGIFISQSTIDDEIVWAIYDTYGNSIVPEYTDQEAVTLQCKNGATLTLSGDDLPDNLGYGNSVEVVSYTPPQNQ